MPLDPPQGCTCFVDANIFVYHFIEVGEVSSACRAFLMRVAAGEVEAVSTAGCLADAVHRVMAVEARERFALSSNPVSWLQQHPGKVRELHAFLDAARQLASLPLRLLHADTRVIRDTAAISRQHGLLTNDAVIVALMRIHGLVHLATNDDDFDTVAGLTVWKPRPLAKE